MLSSTIPQSPLILGLIGDTESTSKAQTHFDFCTTKHLNRLKQGSEIVRQENDTLLLKTTQNQNIEVDALCIFLTFQTPKTTLEPQLTFLPRSLISVRNNELPLWKQLMDPRWNNLFFIGMLIGEEHKAEAIQAQCEFIAAYLEGKNALPSQLAMEREMVEAHERRRRIAQRSARHLLEFDCEKYSSDLRLEMKRGAKRAHAMGNRLPLVSQAAASDCILI
jgi:hypothetical protein